VFCCLDQFSRYSVLPPRPMSRGSYVDDTSCLIFVSSLSFVYRNALVTRHPLVSVRQGMIPQRQRGEITRDVDTPPSASSYSGTLDSRRVVQCKP
jgi:hypothetical protein